MPINIDSFLSAHPVFRLADLEFHLGQLSRAGERPPRLRSLLALLLRRKRIQKIRRGSYRSTAGALPLDPIQALASIEPEAVIAFNAALRFHLKEPFPTEVHILVPRFFRGWDFGGHTFTQIQARYPKKGLIALPGTPVRVTSRERTLLDVLDRRDLGGSPQDLWEVLPRIAPFDLDHLRDCLREFDCATTSAKVLYFLESRREALGITTGEFDLLMDRNANHLPLPRHANPWDWRALEDHLQEEEVSLHPDLNLLVPHSLINPEEPLAAPVAIQDRHDFLEVMENDCSGWLSSHLSHHFDFESYRPGQLQAVLRVLRGEDTLAVMATGSGKSLCYLQPSLMLNGPTLVISPLVSLIEDQVSEAQRFGIHAFALDSKNRPNCIRAARQRLREGTLHLVFVPPESLPSLRKALPGIVAHTKQIVVDEAHLIEAWGGGFRRAYTRLRDLLNPYQVPILALTATASKNTQATIIEKLKLVGVQPADFSIRRQGLKILIEEVAIDPSVRDRVVERRPPEAGEPSLPEALFEAKLGALLPFLARQGRARGIVYCTRISEAKRLVMRISAETQLAVAAYYSGLDRQEKRARLARFKLTFPNEDLVPIQVMVATVAFGLGINVPDVRFVVHFGLPGSLDAYVQEIGRAGRDDQGAECLLIYERDEFSRRRIGIQKTKKRDVSPATKTQRLGQLERVNSWVSSGTCRHVELSRYFEAEDPGPCLTECDVCETQSPGQGR